MQQQQAPPASKATESAPQTHAVQKDTPEARYCFNLGLYYFERGDLVQAEHLWTKSYSLDPTLPGTKSSLVELLTNQGLKYYGLGELDQAIIKWEQALALDPRNKETKAYLKKALSAKKKMKVLNPPQPTP
jgi:tetratricopeptide (TPR) repeat protein